MDFKIRTTIRIFDTAIVDGERWYTIYSRDKDVYNYIDSLDKKGYYVHKGYMLIDVHEKVMTMLQLKYQCSNRGKI